jgi:hypothetical protein
MNYFPDRWLMVRLSNDGKAHYRIFATWIGGYLDGDSWKLNSGVVSLTETDNHYSFYGTSGSIYICLKNSYGSSGYGFEVLGNLITESLDRGTVIDILPEKTDFTSIVYE